MRHQLLRRAILQLLYQRAVEAPPSLIAGVESREIAHLRIWCRMIVPS